MRPTEASLFLLTKRQWDMWTRLKSLLIFPILAALFTFSMFYRVTNAVIAPDLTREFNLDAQGLGLLGSAFFYTYAIFQIPVGVLRSGGPP